MDIGTSMESFFTTLYVFMDELQKVGALDRFSFTYDIKPSLENVPLHICIKSIKKIQKECKAFTRILRDSASSSVLNIPEEPNCAFNNIDATNNNSQLSSTFHAICDDPNSTSVISNFDPQFHLSNSNVQIISQPINNRIYVANEVDSTNYTSSNLVIPFSKLNIDTHVSETISTVCVQTNKSIVSEPQTFMTGLNLQDQQFVQCNPSLTNEQFYVPESSKSNLVSLESQNIAQDTNCIQKTHKKLSVGKQVKEGEVPFFCCRICSVASLTIRDYSSHRCKLNSKQTDNLVVNTDELMQIKKFICNTCKVEFRTYSRVIYHLYKCSPGPYNCNACAKLFSTQKALNYHKKKAHKGEKCFMCEECGKGFERKTSLRKHSVLRHEYDPISGNPIKGPTRENFSCDVCPKTFIKKIFLTHHKLRMHGLDKKFLCPTCGNRFMSKNSLMIHMEIHEEGKKYICNHCMKSFRRKETLHDHIRIHTGERPYQCPKCKKAFVSKSRLNEHINRHNGERRYCCPDCPKSYAAAWDLKKHIQKKHNRDLQSVPVMVIPSPNKDTGFQINQESSQSSQCIGNKDVQMNNMTSIDTFHSKVQHRLQVNPQVINIYAIPTVSIMDSTHPNDPKPTDMSYSLQSNVESSVVTHNDMNINQSI